MSRLFVYSACRPSVLRMDGDEVTQTKISISDSRYVQAVAYPLKGKIQTHTECGISVLPEQASVTPDIDVAQAALDEVFKLRDELKKKKKSADDADGSDDSDGDAKDDDKQ